MKTIQQAISVSFRYPVIFTHSVFDPKNTALVKTLTRGRHTTRARALVVVDDGVVAAWPALCDDIARYFSMHDASLELVRAPLVVPGGEQAKNEWDTVRELMTLAAAEHMDRHSYFVAVGGGSMLDMVGFAAALIHRGLRFMRLPTTVLAQNDAGVGVKNGMNAVGAKNFVGTFAPPFAVLNDGDFLRTLPQREWVGGVAEAFKVAIIKDARFFDYLCKKAAALRDRDQRVMERVVHKTAALHLEHIATSGDPFEFGSARPLDFGHWTAHRLELLSGFTLGHGPAVAIGIALDSTYAMLKRLITPAEHQSIIDGLATCGLPVWSPLLERPGADGQPDVLVGLEQFREHLGGRLCVTLPRSIGDKVEVHRIDLPLMVEAIGRLRPASAD